MRSGKRVSFSSHPTPGSWGEGGGPFFFVFFGVAGVEVSGWMLRWDTWHTPERSDQGGCSVGAVMLHSGQSFPGTPVLLCSTAGTGPGEEKREDKCLHACYISHL